MNYTLLKNKLRLFTIITLGIFISFAQVSCNEDTTTNPTGNSTMRVHLTDAPANYDAVYVDIQAVEVTGVNGAVQINLIRPGIYNLLDFRNGLDTLLGSVLLPAGTVSQIRLILGSNNSILVDGNIYPLSTPSAQQSGLKLNLHQELIANVVYDIWIDFDASLSVVKKGNGEYSLKPVLRAFSRPLTGSISGVVTPLGSIASLVAIQNTDTIGTMTDVAGNFYIGGLNPGTYKIIFNANLGFLNKEVTGITVNAGANTNIGTVIIL